MHVHDIDDFLTPESCAVCRHGVETPPVKKPKKAKKPKQKPKAVLVDPAEKLAQEYAAGARCNLCKGLRGGAAYQCQCERERIAAAHLAEIEAFAAANPDKKGKLMQTASAAAISRVTLRAGLRNAPSGIAGLSVGGALGLVNRVEKGRAMEWRDQHPSGDPLPV